MSRIDAALGRIVSQLPGYEPRAQQFAMARDVDAAIAEKTHLLVEAGTGSGKSFAYLFPILESGKKAVISTGTIALQEQLLRKDLPFLEQAFGRKIKVALAKGRGNYVCLRKLVEADKSLAPSEPERSALDQLIQIRRSGEWDGDRGALPFLPDPRFWNGVLASDGEDCLGPRCPNFAVSPHHVARVACEQAEIVIANHALYLTDLANGTGVVPQHDVAVFDEAHQLERVAMNALTLSVGRWSTTKLVQRLQRRFPNLPVGPVQALLEAENQVMESVYRRGHGQFPIEADSDLAAGAHRLAKALAAIGAWLERARPDQMLLLDGDGQQAHQRAQIQREQMADVAITLASRWEQFAELASGAPGAANRANWMRVEPARDSFDLHSAPLDVGESLRELLWNKRTCILTSATLAVDGSFEFVKRALGLRRNFEAVLGSPFRFEDQALLYVPSHVPPPSAPHYLEAIVPVIEEILQVSRGRAFVLFTSYRALRQVSQMLMGRLPYPCKTQEELPRTRLLEWFRETPNSVLFATATFWEGVDVPGEALSCVIIDKLPFASPDDPIVQAITERMKAANEDWFNDYMLPRAVLALKQGFGRLIRSRNDTGLIAILDRRLTSMRYGEVILRSLPPARRIAALPPSLDAVFARRPASATAG